MQLRKRLLNPVTVAVAMGVTASSISFSASADLSANVGVSNLYLFRGDNLSNSAPQVFGGLDYSHEMGAYAGIWASSEGDADSQEYDLYVGFTGEMEGFGYDISLISYQYPEKASTETGNDIGDQSEVILSFSYMGANFSYVDSLQGQNEGLGYTYYTLGYATDMFGVTVGVWDDLEAVLNIDDTVTHVDVSFFATDELTFTASQKVDAPDTIDDDLLFVVNWTKSFDL